MGRITTGVGLISGFPIADVVDQLIALEARPLNLTNIRIQETQAQRTAFLDINARLLGLKSASSQLNDLSFFRSTAATSSDPDVLQATTTSGSRCHAGFRSAWRARRAPPVDRRTSSALPAISWH